MKRHELVDVAHRIARRITAEALWREGACTWEVQELVRETGHGRKEAAAGGVYQGSAGIAWFLAEAHRASGDAELAEVAAAGIEHALAWAEEQPPGSFSFHAGPLGVAWVAVRLADLLARPELRGRAERLLARMAGHEERDAGLDVIAGAAGAVPALLDLASTLGSEAPSRMAAALGERLLATALRAPAGWSWGTIGPAASRHLTGLAHGASGMALALLELARATGDGRFRFAAEMGFLYERRAFDPQRGNWPDLRHKTISRLYSQGGPEAVREAAEAGDISAFEPSYMNAWCHGAPGIGLARVRAFELTGAAAYRREAEAALASTLPGVAVPPQNTFCLCHGTAGNCELLLEAYRAGLETAGADLAAACHACAEFGRDTYEDAGHRWPCGTIDSVPDPSLLVGEAGIGLFYLRLADPATPSILLLRPAGSNAGEVAEDGGFAALAAAWTGECFAASRAAFPAHGLPWPPQLGELGAPLTVSPAEAACRAIAELLREVPDDGVRRDLADAFEIDRVRHEMALEPPDLAAESVAVMTRPAHDAVDWRTARVARAAGLRCLSTRRDWLGADGEAGAGAAAGAVPWALQPRGGEVRLRRLRPWTAQILAALEPPATAAEVAARLAERVEGAESIGSAALAGHVEDQLRELYRGGMVDLHDGEASAGRRAS